MKKNKSKTNIIIVTDIPQKFERIKRKYGIETSSNHTIGPWTLFGRSFLIKRAIAEMKEINI